MDLNVKLTYDGYMKKAYSANVDARGKNGRIGQTNKQLVLADSSALAKIADKLKELHLSSDEDAKNDVNSVLKEVRSFVDIYNNLDGSVGASDDKRVKDAYKKIEKLMKSHKEDLENIGITLKSDGSLKLDKQEFLNADIADINAVFSDKSESSFVPDLVKLSKRINKAGLNLTEPVRKQEDDLAAVLTEMQEKAESENVVSSSKIDARV
ncbi:MAG: hypothetical protein VZR00_03920 [Lachnospiraceae bacterium]|jgi:ferredoxin-fold anticodon binding domain-containing protein|nr:hypothetical protein [Lachnospiraceae bacterium]MEE3461025.1 hypothetical protein [Lachnospiraceae bacterium]